MQILTLESGRILLSYFQDSRLRKKRPRCPYFALHSHNHSQKHLAMGNPAMVSMLCDFCCWIQITLIVLYLTTSPQSTRLRISFSRLNVGTSQRSPCCNPLGNSVYPSVQASNRLLERTYGWHRFHRDTPTKSWATMMARICLKKSGCNQSHFPRFGLSGWSIARTSAWSCWRR